MKKLMTICAVAVMILAVSGVAQATPIVISVTGTADSTAMGYTAGESYTFNWTINAGYDGSGGDSFNSSINLWHVEQTTDPLLWSDVSGDGLSGTYSRPSGTFEAPYDYFYAHRDGLNLRVDNDNPSTSSQGLTVNGVQLQILYISNLVGTGLNLDYSDTSFVNPATWAAEYAGTYDSGVSETGFYVRDENSNHTNFTATSFEIASVPEPATICLLGLGSLALIRRKRKA